MSSRPWVALAVVLGVVLTGCQPTVSVPPSDVELPPPPVELEEFYSQDLDWQDCGGGRVCATAYAPINWALPEGGTITLALIKQPASGTAEGSILVNPGGPGGSGWALVASAGSNAVGASVSERYDIIGWDPRGVGQSTPVRCFSDDDAKDQALYGTFASPYGSQGWIDELTVAQQPIGESCLENTGELLQFVDAASNARDMDMIRALVGDDRLNYLGYSYGTFFGSIYAELFPERVGRMVLDGAIDPSLAKHEMLAQQMAAFDRSFRTYLDWCLRVDGCPFTGTVDDAAAQTRDILESVDARALVNADGRLLDSATLGSAIASNLYTDGRWPQLNEMLTQLAQGDPTLTFASADNYYSRNSDGTYASNAVEVYVAATCADGDFASDPASTLERIAEIDEVAPILGTYFAYDDFAVLDVACSNWPVPPAELPEVDAAGAAPILVIGTSNDPATPYEWAVSLVEQLSSGVLISHEGEGHTIYNHGNACVDEVVNTFFLTGAVPSSDPRC